MSAVDVTCPRVFVNQNPCAISLGHAPNLGMHLRYYSLLCPELHKTVTKLLFLRCRADHRVFTLNFWRCNTQQATRFSLVTSETSASLRHNTTDLQHDTKVPTILRHGKLSGRLDSSKRPNSLRGRVKCSKTQTRTSTAQDASTHSAEQQTASTSQDCNRTTAETTPHSRSRSYQTRLPTSTSGWLPSPPPPAKRRRSSFPKHLRSLELGDNGTPTR